MASVRNEFSTDAASAEVWAGLPDIVAVIMLHPGAVRTELTGGQGMIGVDASARGLLQRIDELTIEGTGRFLHQNGEELPW